MTVSADVSFHGVTGITASSSYTMGAPLILTLNGKEGMSSRIVLFTNDEVLTQSLIDAINSATVVQKSEAA